MSTLFESLAEKSVLVEGTILKPNMVVSGNECPEQAGIQRVAEITLNCLLENVPSNLPGITFLSGGQSDFDATAHLDAMNKIGGNPWKLSFSYGRALQQAALKTWSGNQDNQQAAQEAFSHRAKMNMLAAKGEWSENFEG